MPFRRVNRGSASASLAVTCGGSPSPGSAPACALTLALPCFLAAAGTSDAVKRCSSKIGNGRALHALRIGNRSLSKIRFCILTTSIVLAAFALSVRATTAKQSSIEDKVLSAVQQPSVDNSAEIDSQGSRMRSLTLDPGSAIILRSDKGRPTLVHVIKGTLTSRPQDMPEVVLHAGDGYAGVEDSECLLENTGSEPAEFIWLSVYRYTP